MGVGNLDAPRLQFTRQPERQPPVTAGTAAQIDDRNPLREKPFAQGPDPIQAQHDRVDAPAQTSDGFGHQDLGAGDLHDVEDKGNADGLRLSG
jgi:hypothetical protein